MLDMVEMVKVVVVAYSRNFSDTSAKESGMASERWLRSVDGFTKVMSMSMVISCMVARLVPMTSKVSKAVAVTIVLMVSMEAKATSMDVYEGHMEIRGPKMFVTFRHAHIHALKPDKFRSHCDSYSLAPGFVCAMVGLLFWGGGRERRPYGVLARR